LIIYSDLDGTFLDYHTYSFAASLPALRRALDRGASVVFCSSKTRAEIQALQATLSLSSPFISENGGGIFIPEGFFSFELEELPREGSIRLLRLGKPYKELVTALTDVRERLGVDMRGFSDMTAEEIGQLCGLGLCESLLAKQREFDEPFLLKSNEEGLLDKICEVFAEGGMRVTRGGRLFHLTGENDKGEAIRRLTELFQRDEGNIRTVGIGDSVNDLPMLEEVDHPVLVQKPDGSYDETVLSRLPDATRAKGAGPVGWASEVMNLI
jgi:mannosyl-3-phosphoglycerate phosphatase